MNKNISEPKVLMVNAGNANAATGKKGKKTLKNLLRCFFFIKRIQRQYPTLFYWVVGELLDTKSFLKLLKNVPIS